MATSLRGSRSDEARVIGGKRCDLFLGQLAGNAAHLLADVVVSASRLQSLHLLFEVGALLAYQTRRARGKAQWSLTRRAGCHTPHRTADFDQTMRNGIRG